MKNKFDETIEHIDEALEENERLPRVTPMLHVIDVRPEAAPKVYFSANCTECDYCIPETETSDFETPTGTSGITGARKRDDPTRCVDSVRKSIETRRAQRLGESTTHRFSDG